MSEETKTKYLEMLKQCIENDGNQLPIELSGYVAMHTLAHISLIHASQSVDNVSDINKAEHELTRYITNTVTSIVDIITNHYYKSAYTSDRYFIDYMKHINNVLHEINELRVNTLSICDESLNNDQVEYLSVANSLIRINFALIRDIINNMIWAHTHNRTDTCVIKLHKSDLMNGEFVTVKSGIEIHGSVFYIRINPDTYLDDSRIEYKDEIDGRTQFSIAKKYDISDSAREMIHFDHYNMHVLSKDSIPKCNIILLY